MTRLRNRANAFLSISAGFLSMQQAVTPNAVRSTQPQMWRGRTEGASPSGSAESVASGSRSVCVKGSREGFESARSRGLPRTRRHRGRTGVGILERRARPPRRRERFGAASGRRLVISTVNVHA